MISHFFTFGGRKYINNAIVTAHVLEFISNTFGDVMNFRIHFRKPFCSKGEFNISLSPLDGYFVGHFDVKEVRFYFSYMPTDISADERELSMQDILSDFTTLNVCYYIAETTHQRVLRAFENNYGPRTADDKSIFVMYEIPDTSVFSNIMKSKKIPNLFVTEPGLIGDRKFKLSVYVDNKLLGYRYNTVKKFIL